MSLHTHEELLHDLNAAVRSGGKGGKTTAADVRGFLTTLLDELQADQEELTTRLAGKADLVTGKVPAEQLPIAQTMTGDSAEAVPSVAAINAALASAVTTAIPLTYKGLTAAIGAGSLKPNSSYLITNRPTTALGYGGEILVQVLTGTSLSPEAILYTKVPNYATAIWKAGATIVPNTVWNGMTWELAAGGDPGQQPGNSKDWVISTAAGADAFGNTIAAYDRIDYHVADDTISQRTDANRNTLNGNAIGNFPWGRPGFLHNSLAATALDASLLNAVDIKFQYNSLVGCSLTNLIVNGVDFSYNICHNVDFSGYTATTFLHNSIYNSFPKTQPVYSAKFIVNSKEVGGSSTSEATQTVTYKQLTDLCNNAGLRAGSYYLLTDYQLTHTIPNTSVLYTSPAERLLLLAASPTELAPLGYSLTYTSDMVYYSRQNNQSRVPGATKGYVYRRIDTIQNNDLEIDFRNVRFRRWAEPVHNAAASYAGNATVYTSCVDNGNAFQDSEMFVSYARTKNNRWAGFDQHYNPSIFGYINYVADGASRTLNTVLDNSSIVNVSATDGIWFYNSHLIRSTISNLKMTRLQFFAFLQVTMVSSTLTNNFVSSAQIGISLYSSTLDGEIALNGKTFIGNKDVSLLATASANPAKLEFVFQAGFADDFSATLLTGQAGTFTAYTLSNIKSVVYMVNAEEKPLPFTLAAGDTLKVTITRDTPTVGAVVTLSA